MDRDCVNILLINKLSSN